jgi:hypothetical protein
LQPRIGLVVKPFAAASRSYTVRFNDRVIRK